MSWFLFFSVMLCDFHIILALFIVTAPKLTYTAKRGDRVQMTCNFPLPNDGDISDLKVSWQYINQEKSLPTQVIMFRNGKEDLLDQNNTYRGRATLMKEELKKGEANLCIQDVQLSDAGKYLCALELGGSDYQKMNLEVHASYAPIKKAINISLTGKEILLTCQSLGFPEAEVYWQTNGSNVSSTAFTSHTRTTNGFYNTTSTIKVINMNQSYNCVFWNKAMNDKTRASFQPSELDEVLIHGISESIAKMKKASQKNNPDNNMLLQNVIIIIGSTLACLTVLTLVMYTLKRRGLKCFRKKGRQSPVI